VTTDSDRWRRISALYDEALARPSAMRQAYLQGACAGDEELRREVESLLAHDAARAPVDVPALAAAAQALGGGPTTSLVGRRLGVYQVTAFLGAGGMGEVYRARDTTLGREVAIKVLPAASLDAAWLDRLRREARVMAGLNHPNIAAIYGVEHADGVHGVVLELVDGPTLADRIARGPIRLTEALHIGRQIAEALRTAHNRGIIHRDIKPANIKITRDGIVKVLDFGLAKAVAPDAANADAMELPTVTISRTAEGLIVGTPAYMSPEQARGQRVDKRTDIWSFGCVLYEMLAGHAAFRGETMSDTIACVLGREPDWSALPHAVPSAIIRLLRRSLTKDLNRRLADISDARLDLEEELVPSSSEGHASLGGWRLATMLGIALLTGGLVATTVLWRSTAPVPPRLSRMTIAPPNGERFSAAIADRFLAVAPDGAHFAYLIAKGPQSNRLFVRSLDQLEPTELRGPGTVRQPFFSPDGAWIGYFDAGAQLKKVATTGGPAVTVCPLDGSGPRGATWGTDDTIVFATSDTASGLWRVPAGGGEPTVITKPNPERGESDHLWPRFIPGREAVLYTIWPMEGGIANAQVAVVDLRTNTPKVLVRGATDAEYVPTGHLIYGQGGTLRAIGFDLERLEVKGASVPVVPQAVTNGSGANAFGVSRDGMLVYLAGSAAAAPTNTLVWVDRSGREEPLGVPARAWKSPRLSPDGTQLAANSNDAEFDIWIWDFVRRLLTRLTQHPRADFMPVWAPDGKHVFFASYRTGPANLFSQATDGTSPAEQLTHSPTLQAPTDVTRDGKQLVFFDLTTNDVMALDLDSDHRVQTLVQTPNAERNGTIAPDGRWLAYESNESGPSEIYVRPYPDVNGGRWLVSKGGGSRPRWARDGQELFYVAPPGSLMSVRVTGGKTWSAGDPIKLFEGRYYYGTPPDLGVQFDVSLDGQRFLMMKPANDVPEAPSLVVVQHWLEELKQRVPTK
jgi:serine/threonine-protein kinase